MFTLIVHKAYTASADSEELVPKKALCPNLTFASVDYFIRNTVALRLPIDKICLTNLTVCLYPSSPVSARR